MKRKKKSNDGLTISIFFMLVGIGLIVGGIFLGIKNTKFKNNSDKIRGRVASVETYRDSDDEKHTKVYVNYKYKGNNYEYVELSGDTKKDEGEFITLYVNKDNPSDVRSSVDYIATIALVLMGLIPLFIGGVGIKLEVSKKKEIKSTHKTEGEVVIATVDDIIQDMEVSVNGRSPYILRCSYTDKDTGKIYEFKSERIWDYSEITLVSGDSVRVNIFSGNFNNYYVNVKDEGNRPEVVDFT